MMLVYLYTGWICAYQYQVEYVGGLYVVCG